MSKLKSTSESDGAKEPDEVSAVRKGITAYQRVNIRMVQNVILIWLDSNIDENNDDCHNTISQLRRVVNVINTFIDGDQCVQFINNMDNEKACMIISGSLGEYTVPRELRSRLFLFRFRLRLRFFSSF